MNTWVVVTDSRRARIFTQPEKGAALEELNDLVHPAFGRGDADSRGRGFDGRGGTRHGLEPKTLPKEHDAAEFAHELGQYLKNELAANHFKDLVVVAAPDWLGHLRQSLHDSVTDVLKKTLPKDLVTCSPADLLAQLKSGGCL